MNHRKCRKLMAEAFYDELPAHKKLPFDDHLRECAECTEAYKRLSSTLGLMQQRQRPDHDEAYWSSYWLRLQSEIHRDNAPAPKEASWVNSLQSLLQPKIVYATGAGVLLIGLGVLVGRFIEQPDTKQTLTSGQSSLSVVANAGQVKRTEEYLDRSRTLLLGIVNFDTTGTGGRPVDLSRQQRVSRELLNEAQVLQAELKDPRQARLRKLVSDLEVIMLQIANLEEQNDFPGIEIVKSGVDRSALLLKINLEQMRMDKQPPPLKSERPNS